MSDKFLTRLLLFVWLTALQIVPVVNALTNPEVAKKAYFDSLLVMFGASLCGGLFGIILIFLISKKNEQN